MAAHIQSKLLQSCDDHQDACFLSTTDSQHIIIAKKYGLSVYCVDDDEDDLNTNCITHHIALNYKSSIKQMTTIQQGNMMHNVLKSNLNPKYTNDYTIFCEWDSILILFENGHFCWFYLDIFNEIITNNTMILWLIAPNMNHKYDGFMRELQSRSLSLELHLDDWRMELQSIHNEDNNCNALILSIYSFLGNVVLILPIIYNNNLCFNCDDPHDNDHILFQNESQITALWQIRSINGFVCDFKFNRITFNNDTMDDIHSVSIHFLLFYIHNHTVNLLSDHFQLLFDEKQHKLMINKAVDMNEMRQTVIFGQDGAYLPQITLAPNNKYLIPQQLKSCNVNKLQQILNNKAILMMLCRQNSIEIQMLTKIIHNEIMLKRNSTNMIDCIFPKQIVRLTEYDALLVFDFAMIHYEESPYNKTQTKIYKLPFIADIIVANMIMNVVYDAISSLLWIATLNGNIYSVGLDGIRHRHNEWIQYKLRYTLKYVNIHKLLLLNNYTAFAFGALSSHKLFALNNMQTSAFIPQYNGVRGVTIAKVHRLFDDEAIFSAYGYNNGGCIAKYQCIVATRSVLDEVQHGFDCISSIFNVDNKLLVFVIADQTRIRSLSDSSLPELQITEFETNAQTLAVAYITDDVLLQITTDALLVIHVNNGKLKEIKQQHITYADIDAAFAAIIITKPLQDYCELYMYQLSPKHMVQLVYKIQLKHANISAIKIIHDNDELFGVLVASYDATLNIYHPQHSATPIISTSLNHLPFDEHTKESNREPQENIVAQSIAVITDEDQHKQLYIGTRNGCLIQYDLNEINKTKPILKNMGDLPLILVPIQLNLDEQDENPLNLTQFKGKHALLCISERSWILFHNKHNEIELWPLNYPPNAVSYAISFNQDGDNYLLLIVNGCMDIVRVMLEPRLHCLYTKIGQTVSHIVNLQETNNLLYVTTNNQYESNDSVLNFVDKDVLFYDETNRNIVEYEAVLPDTIVTAIDIIESRDDNKQYILYLLALNVVLKRYFKQCINPCIVLINAQYDKHLKKFVKFSELARYNLFETDEFMKLLSMPYNIISFKSSYISERILSISTGNKLLLFTLKDEYKLVKCSEVTLGDFIKDIVYDETSELLSILYEKKGVDIMNIKRKEDDESQLELLNIIKSWNGIFYSSKHLLLRCEKEEKENNVKIETLICDQAGNISFMTNVSEEDEKEQSDTNHILEHKYGLSLDKNGGCCVNQLMRCQLSHNNSEYKIIAICSNGYLFEICLS